jgi:hypothetical protein
MILKKKNNKINILAFTSFLIIVAALMSILYRKTINFLN